jgi:hypothetical protein
MYSKNLQKAFSFALNPSEKEVAVTPSPEKASKRWMEISYEYYLRNKISISKDELSRISDC